MKRFLRLFLLIATLVSFREIIAQQPDTTDYPYWIGMMQDPSANFYDVQRAFNVYWANREITRGSGWKPFKRWEYMAQNRILPDGTRHDPDHVWNEYQAYVQKHSDRDNQGDWVNLGPFTVPLARGYQGLGRINAIAFDPADPNVIYIGAPSGGLWRSPDNGETWECLTDELPTLGVSSIVIDFNDPDVIYLGTGDRDAGDAAGLGVMKSTDGGITWMCTNSGMDNKTVGKLIMHPGDPSTILAATSGGAYKTIDGGQSWYRTLAGDHKDVVFKIDNPDVVFTTTSGKLFASFDLGETWSQVTNGITAGYRGAIGVTPADPNVVYFFTTTSSSYKGIFRSTDGGNSFALMSTSPNIMSWGCNDSAEGGQAWYDLDIAVDEQDPNTVYAGGVNCFKTTDGGATWFIVSHWWGDCGVPAVHADLHILEYHPHDGRLFAGNDGGIYFSSDDGGTWTEISNGLAISQTYRLGQSATSRNLVINGYQDNGTSTYTGEAWLNVYGGDGMECAFDYQDSRYSYATLYYGSIFRLFNHGNSSQIAGEGVNGITEGGAWVTPFILSEANPAAMFAGYKNIWYCDNVKAGTIQWKKISEGETADVNVLEQSPADPNILYAARGNSLVRTDQAFGNAVEWISLNNFLPNSSSISDIEAHPFDPDVVYMTQGNHAYRSSDRGLGWIDITGSLPNIYFSGITYYKNSQEGLYLGTDAGIYYRDLSMDDWIQYSGGFPVAGRVSEIDIFYDPVNPEGDMLKASTYGRGLWESAPYHGIPSADFVVDQTLIPAGCEVNFTDRSLGVPTSWHWTFDGASNPSSTERNPSGIVYENEGIYSVKLVTSNSLGCDSLIRTDYITVSEAITPLADFSAPVRSFCSGEAVATFYDSSLYCPIAWDWSFQPASVTFLEGTSSTSRNPVVSFEEPGSYAVTLTVSNLNGSSSVTKENYIMVGGEFLPFTEDFETGTFSSRSWEIQNPDGYKTWEIVSVAGTTPGDKAARVNIYQYNVIPGQRDRLISPPLNLTGYVNAYLSFQHAYAQEYTMISDSLIISISTDCGTTWTRLLELGECGIGNFVTHPPTSEEFIPQGAEDWCGGGYGSDCNTVDLSAWVGLQDVRIRFESYNFLGNNLYIDNITLFTTVAIDQPQQEEVSVIVFPNPTNGEFTLVVNHAPSEVSLKILNLDGQAALEEKLVNPKGNLIKQFNLAHLPKGIYLVEVKGDHFLQNRKLVLD